jgi:hypothetical protein
MEFAVGRFLVSTGRLSPWVQRRCSRVGCCASIPGEQAFEQREHRCMQGRRNSVQRLEGRKLATSFKIAQVAVGDAGAVRSLEHGEADLPANGPDPGTQREPTGIDALVTPGHAPSVSPCHVSGGAIPSEWPLRSWLIRSWVSVSRLGPSRASGHRVQVANLRFASMVSSPMTVLTMRSSRPWTSS